MGPRRSGQLRLRWKAAPKLQTLAHNDDKNTPNNGGRGSRTLDLVQIIRVIDAKHTLKDIRNEHFGLLGVHTSTAELYPQSHTIFLKQIMSFRS